MEGAGGQAAALPRPRTPSVCLGFPWGHGERQTPPVWNSLVEQLPVCGARPHFHPRVSEMK